MSVYRGFFQENFISPTLVEYTTVHQTTQTATDPQRFLSPHLRHSTQQSYTYQPQFVYRRQDTEYIPSVDGSNNYIEERQTNSYIGTFPQHENATLETITPSQQYTEGGAFFQTKPITVGDNLHEYRQPKEREFYPTYCEGSLPSPLSSSSSSRTTAAVHTYDMLEGNLKKENKGIITTITPNPISRATGIVQCECSLRNEFKHDCLSNEVMIYGGEGYFIQKSQGSCYLQTNQQLMLQPHIGNRLQGTREKSSWPVRVSRSTKYKQCRHRNIFKNFGNIFRKFLAFHPHFTSTALEYCSGNVSSLREFQAWIKREIRLENKKDFIEAWTVWKNEDQKVRDFKILLRSLSKDFFQDFILIYLLNSKLQDLEVHLHSIGPCLAAINQPAMLFKFKPV